jgi:hypothetical protein
MPNKSRKLETHNSVLASPLGDGLLVVAGDYYPHWIDTSSMDDLIVAVGAVGAIEVRGMKVDGGDTLLSPVDGTTLPLVSYALNTTYVCTASLMVQVPGPLPRYIAIKGTLANTQFLYFCLTRSIA